MDHHNNKRKRRPHKRGIWDPNYPISAKMRSRHDGLDVQSSDSDTDECVMLDAPASSTSENENINEIQYMKSLPNSPADQLDNVSDSEESGNQSDESESFDTSESTQGDSSEDETSSDEELAGDFANLEQLLFTNETSQATLVFGIHTLLKEEVSKEEVESARRALEEYCGLYPLHYEAEDQTFDLHMLLHLPDSVLELGPLQMHSTDAFGNAKFRLGQDIHGSGARVAKKLQNTMQIINFQTCLQFKYEKDEAQKIQVLGGKVLTEKISREVIDFLENRVIVLEDDYTMEFYLRAKVNSVTFTSEFYTKEKTTDSSFVKYKKNDSQEEFARVMYFVTVNTDKVYFIGKKIDLMSPVFENNEMAVSVDHIRPYSVTNEIVMCSASKIVMPLIKVESFLCIPPNTFERSL
ncbi:uncharacterized protein LOC132200121 isoform X2 [Neocloeon triangulifer]|uniref:uncharacterized protein LOC132200121 isoform X2 n=1 Tax=Neocloeon triangulifer TaxID=2078957 RepID=UPI00286F4533|nr:uncharacterized protein LOC132200121 isoform X2 [Neocloeon triangulifer]